MVQIPCETKSRGRQIAHHFLFHIPSHHDRKMRPKILILNFSVSKYIKQTRLLITQIILYCVTCSIVNLSLAEWQAYQAVHTGTLPASLPAMGAALAGFARNCHGSHRSYKQMNIVILPSTGQKHGVLSLYYLPLSGIPLDTFYQLLCHVYLMRLLSINHQNFIIVTNYLFLYQLSHGVYNIVN